MSLLKSKSTSEICQDWFIFSDGLRLPRPRPDGFGHGDESAGGGEYLSEQTEAYVLVENVLGTFGRGTRFPHRLRELLAWVHGKGEPVERFRLFEPGSWLNPDVVCLGFTHDYLVRKALRRFERRLESALRELTDEPALGATD